MDLLAMRLSAIRYAAAGINLYEFTPLDGAALPAFGAGAHIDLHLPNGLVRQYSLCNPSHEHHRFVVGVKRDINSRGGSRCVHDELRAGSVLQVGGPRNNFELNEDALHTVLIAGGIGVTPIACMVQRLQVLGRSFELHYGVRQREEAAFLDVLAGTGCHLHVDAEHGGVPLDIAAVLAAAPADAHLYCCGPGPMLDAFEAAAAGRPPALVHVERFSPVQPAAVAGGFTVKLARTGGSVYVAPGHSILDTLRAGGIDVPASCEQGICGTCETRVLAGTPDHRDSLLSDEEKAANNVMMVCCSGSKEDILILDL
ncbi:PDR/VanB family oxidoreductase [Caenimonas terrae]|uniref:PDR/VanB family oxidoreductase n=1 Tax=Caenimonas terrae TaxID=696074 RepID=A0ABW0N898_9BURK